MNRALMAALLALSTSAVAADSGFCHKEWCTSGIVAATTNDDQGIGVGVAFVGLCDTAFFFIAGNDRITRGTLLVDDEVFVDGEFGPTDGGVHLKITEGALRALKHGNKAALLTDQGTVVVSLAGSSVAIDAAYGACIDKAAESVAGILRPMQPSAPSEPAPTTWSF